MTPPDPLGPRHRKLDARVSRIALTDAAGPKFGDLWEEMARTSFKAFRSYLGLPGDPVEWRDRYNLSDLSPEQQPRRVRSPIP